MMNRPNPYEGSFVGLLVGVMVAIFAGLAIREACGTGVMWAVWAAALAIWFLAASYDDRRRRQRYTSTG